jgi:hypothetical protein
VYHDINRWIKSGCQWHTGAELYILHGTNRLLLKLCGGAESSFARDKLTTALKAMAADAEPVQESRDMAKEALIPDKPTIKVWDKKAGVKDYFSLPQHLKAKRDEISTEFKDVIRWRKEMHLLIGTSDKRMITLEEAFAIMDQVDGDGNAVPFVLTYVTYNSDLGTGGEIIKALSKVRFKQQGIARFSTSKTERKNRKNPNHGTHGTMTLQWVNTLEIRKVHTYLIFEINDRPVSISKYG